MVAHLTQFLMTFIGEGLTLTLLEDTWPEVMYERKALFA